MTDPTFHLVGSFLELNQITGGPKYLRKDDVCMVSTTNHRVTLYVKGRPDSETLSFVNSENQQRFVQQLLTDISSDETPFKDCMNTVKDAMEDIKRAQHDLSASVDTMTSTFQDLKEDIKKDLQEYIDTTPEKENPYDALDNTSTDTTCNTLILLATILLSIIGVISLQKNLPLLT